MVEGRNVVEEEAEENIDRIRDEPEDEPDLVGDADPDDEDASHPVQAIVRRTKVTQTQYYSSMISHRSRIFNTVLHGGPLTQQYLVNAYVNMEGHRIRFITKNQASLHVAKYQGLMNYLNTRAERVNYTIGNVVILPSTFIGSPRAMKQAYQDALAIGSKFGRPRYFLTFTCKPKRTEIIENIPEFHFASDHPEIVAKVFRLKLNELPDFRQCLPVVRHGTRVKIFESTIKNCYT